MNGKNLLLTIEDANKLIHTGAVLVIAGHESLLAKLDEGNWIAGTIPYFMTHQGVIRVDDKVFVTDFTDFVDEFRLINYNVGGLRNFVNDRYDDGLTYVIIPAFTQVHREYAYNAVGCSEMYYVPTMGWVSGVALDSGSEVKPKVFCSNKVMEDSLVALHMKLKGGVRANISIINLFEPDLTSKIHFNENAFEVKTAVIDGETVNLADYIRRNNIDIKRPFIGDYSGAYINSAIQEIDDKTGVIKLFAPVREGITYYLAKPLDNYVGAFMSRIKAYPIDNVVTSVNCILNYVYANLDGVKELDGIYGPFTFGEVAYVLVNQTLVNLEFIQVV